MLPSTAPATSSAIESSSTGLSPASPTGPARLAGAAPGLSAVLPGPSRARRSAAAMLAPGPAPAAALAFASSAAWASARGLLLRRLLLGLPPLLPFLLDRLALPSSSGISIPPMNPSTEPNWRPLFGLGERARLHMPPVRLDSRGLSSSSPARCGGDAASDGGGAGVAAFGLSRVGGRRPGRRRSGQARGAARGVLGSRGVGTLSLSPLLSASPASLSRAARAAPASPRRPPPPAPLPAPPSRATARTADRATTRRARLSARSRARVGGPAARLGDHIGGRAQLGQNPLHPGRAVRTARRPPVVDIGPQPGDQPHPITGRQALLLSQVPDSAQIVVDELLALDPHQDP